MFLFLIVPLFILWGIPETLAQSKLAQLQGYSCQQPNGYERVSHQCDIYVECQQNTAFQYSCPDGLHFNPRKQWPEYPCGFPSEAKCGDGDAIQEAQSSPGCIHRYGFYRINNENCGTYTLCHGGIATVMPCPFGLVFNTETENCDWPFKVPECNHIKALEQYQCAGTEAKYRYGKSCKRFVSCYAGTPMVLKCDEDHRFDENTQTCIGQEYVVDCDPREDA